MFRPIRRPILIIAGLGVALSLSACAGGAPQGPTASPALSAKAAYTAYIATLKLKIPGDNDLSLLQKADSSTSTGFASAKAAASGSKKSLSKWNGQVSAIHFPVTVKATVSALLAANKKEIADLGAFAGITATKQSLATYAILADSARGSVADAALSRALGHPLSQATEALDRLFVADYEYLTKLLPQESAFNAAVRNRDLSGLLAATKGQSSALSDYVAAVRAVPVPLQATSNLPTFIEDSYQLQALYSRQLAATTADGILSLPSTNDLLSKLFDARNAVEHDVFNAIPS